MMFTLPRLLFVQFKCIFVKQLSTFSFQSVLRPQGSARQVTLSPSKHFSIYNPTVRPSPAANHSALFDYSAELYNKMLHYVYAL